MPQIQKLTDKRNIAINNFIKEFTEEQFVEICKKANNSSFLTGDNDRKWKADFDFLMRIDKATNILEGKYDNDKRDKSKKTYNNYNQREKGEESLENLYANI